MSIHAGPTPEDEEIAELLKEAGPRAEPSPEVAREIEAIVRAEWQHVVGVRKRKHGFVWAAAAAFFAVAIAVTIGLQVMRTPSDRLGPSIAVLERSGGDVFVAADGRHWSRLGEGDQIAVGHAIRSDARAALMLENGLALRIDRGSVLHVAALDRIVLNVGAVYIDSPSGGAPRALIVDTHVGAVSHLGTQYQVRSTAEGIDIGVREGSVVIENAAGRSIAKAGERLQIATHGTVQRTNLSPTDAQWDWASEVAPTFEIENQSLAAFLIWVARETGRALVYESPQAQAAAAEVVLHGSIEGLMPDAALVAVLATTPLRRNSANSEAIEIVFASADPARDAPPSH